MSTEEFDGLGFAPGSVKGVRSFNVDRLGRLVGVTFRQVWTPGENYAVCLRETFDPVLNSPVPGGVYTPVFARDTPTHYPAPQEPATITHTLTDCQHGFYAYYDGSNDYGRKNRVTAVIEGYGETVIGTRGFRAMKARILAVVVNDEVPGPLERRLGVNYPGVPVCAGFEELVSEFPPDVQVGSPDADPEFWTRSA